MVRFTICLVNKPGGNPIQVVPGRMIPTWGSLEDLSHGWPFFMAQNGIAIVAPGEPSNCIYTLFSRTRERRLDLEPP